MKALSERRSRQLPASRCCGISCQLFTLLALSIASTLAGAQCQLAAGVVASAQQLAAQGQPIVSHLNLGFAEADNPLCLSNAKADFNYVLANGQPKDKTVATGALAYTSALSTLQAGDTPGAVAQLQAVVANYRQPALYFRSLDLMIRLLNPTPDSPQWASLTQALDSLSHNDNYDGYAINAIRALCAHDIAKGNATAANTRIENYLAVDLPLQARLQAEIVYLELMILEHDFRSAQLQTIDLDTPVGTTLLDPLWRVRYLQDCVDAWSGTSDSQSQARLSAYQSALAKATQELQ